MCGIAAITVLVASALLPTCAGFLHGDLFGPVRHKALASRRATVLSDAHRFSDELVICLDLIPLLRGISDHAGTRRGRQAILALVGQDTDYLTKISTNIPARRRRVLQQYNNKRQDARKRHSEILSIATSAEEARREYELVEQAMLALNDDAQCDDIANLTYPPLYAAGSSPADTSTCPDTDDDDWMWLPLDELSLEHVLQAEQILITLLQVKQWAQQNDVSTWLPGLSAIGRWIPHEDLLPVLNHVGKAVEISRVRSATDPDGRSTFVFRLKEGKFPHLGKLRAKEQQLLEVIDREMKVVLRKTKGSPEIVDCDGRKVLLVPKSAATPDLGLVRGSEAGRCYVEPRSVVDPSNELAAVRQALTSSEAQITQDLIQTIVRAQHVIDASLQVAARLDVVFARAAFGMRMSGSVPKVGYDGCISIQQFVHPVLALDKFDTIVPTDLHLADGTDGSNRSLVISGPNGGGKSVAMKSFGVVSMLSKMSIPIPHRSEEIPRVDFFQQVLVELGDQQSVIEGESTFMAKINACSSLIQQVQANDRVDSHTLVLLDELGGGTDPAAGGAIGQAILEKLLENDACRIVSTTHSPRLKALSFNDARFDCATVLLKRGAGDYKLPSYQLHYGLIGDSYALGAASRANPPLPDGVIARAAGLLATDSNGGDDQSGAMLQALTTSLEKQVDEATQARQQAEYVRDEAADCRDAMLTMARAYEDRFLDMEQRLESMIQGLKADQNDTLEVLGETLSTLRLAKRKVKDDIELLREQGLKPVSDRYEFVVGEKVIIIAKGPWEGTPATVVVCEGQNSVLVTPESRWNDPSFEPGRGHSIYPEKPMIFQRYELAVWDYDSVWDDDKDLSVLRRTSVRESKQKLVNLITSLGDTKRMSHQAAPRKASNGAKQFVTSRERKALGKKKRNQNK
jgi:dsDNA-specific endonuclease/ATPase MutS2